MGKRELLAKTLEQTGLSTLLSATVSRWNGLIIFNYHRVGNSQDSLFDHALWSATQEEFDQQVRFLKKHFDVVQVADLESVLQNAKSRAVLITFDDGYRDNYDLALPVLKQNDASAVFFITSGFLDDRPLAWWDEIAWMVRSSELPSLSMNSSVNQTFSLADANQAESAIASLLRTFKTLDSQETPKFLSALAESTGSGRCPAQTADDIWMTWEMVREMEQAGMDIGGHTVTHPVLGYCDSERQRHEIFESKQRIESELEKPISAFSYPVGQPDSFTTETRQLVSEAGYDWAFSFYGGYCPACHVDPLDLRRMSVSPQISDSLFRSTARLPKIFARK